LATVSESITKRIGSKGIRLIKAAEGLRLKPYLCSAGVPTIGYGSTGKDITLDMAPITESEAERLLRCGLSQVRKTLSQDVSVSLNQNQYDALASLIYNIGSGNFRSSTLRMKLNRGDYLGAENEFWKWRRAKGVIINGLVKRRELERQLFAAQVVDDSIEVVRDERDTT